MLYRAVGLLFLVLLLVGEVRDSRNNLVETWERHGDTIEVRTLAITCYAPIEIKATVSK
jgi:hypothetical protein